MVVRLLFNNISSTHTINVLLHNFIHSFTCMLTILTNIIHEKLTQRQTEFISLSLSVNFYFFSFKLLGRMTVLYSRLRQYSLLIAVTTFQFISFVGFIIKSSILAPSLPLSTYTRPIQIVSLCLLWIGMKSLFYFILLHAVACISFWWFLDDATTVRHQKQFSKLCL